MGSARTAVALVFGLALVLAWGPGQRASAEPAFNVPPLPDVVAEPPASRTPGAWRVVKEAWSDTDERAFGDFIQAIGDSNCRTVHACLTGPHNIYRGLNPRGAHFYADCADLPYVLRAYFAWMNGLPFAFASAVAPNGYTRDIRYVAAGNRVIEKTAVITFPGQAPPDGMSILRNISGHVSSAMYRYHPETTRGLPTDHYSTAITPRALKAGTVLYDPNGHLTVVYRVDPDGRIHYIDSHPDNSLTRGVYGRKFVRSRPTMGAGFKNWRPVRLVGATRARDGSLIGGHYEYTPNAELPDFSVDQFFGNAIPNRTNWQLGSFAYDSQRLDYYDWVRAAVAGRNLVYDPLEETRNMMQSLCADIGYRVHAVEEAVAAGINRKAQPARLPLNIYGTEGEWEIYSTPSRDARLKTSFVELRNEVARFVAMVEAGSDRVTYTGSDIRGDLARVYAQEAADCNVTYTNSDGRPVPLGFEDVRARLFALSFDPYHCVERRWGATDAAELSSCPDGATKRAWYVAEQRLRNQPDRTYDARMDFSLAELQASKAGSGLDVPPDADLLAVLTQPPAGLIAASSTEGPEALAGTLPGDVPAVLPGDAPEVTAQ